MTAVEALLQRAADVQRLFDEMLGPIPELPNLGFVADAARDLRRYCRPRREPATDAIALDEIGFLVEKPDRGIFTPERWRLACRWGSEDAMLIAASRGVAEELNGRWDVRTLEHYLTFLGERERLLDPESLESLAGGAVRESIAWGPDAPEARQRAEAVVESLRRLAQRDVNTRERWQEERKSHLGHAIRDLKSFALPPNAPAAEPASAYADDPAPKDESAANTEEKIAREKELVIAWVAWASGRRHRRVKQFLFERNGIKPTEEEYAAAKRAINTHHAAKKTRAKKKHR
jgi:hypothetical protein